MVEECKCKKIRKDHTPGYGIYKKFVLIWEYHIDTHPLKGVKLIRTETPAMQESLSVADRFSDIFHFQQNAMIVFNLIGNLKEFPIRLKSAMHQTVRNA